jgi:hypothetical protein
MSFESGNVSYPPPTNLFFFEAIERMEKFIKQKCWELGIRRENEQIVEDAIPLRIEEQCLYTFCQRKKFERDDLIELYCS